MVARRPASGLRAHDRPHLLLHPGRAQDPRAGRGRRARRDPVHRLGADQPRPHPAGCRRVLGPGTARPLDHRLHPARWPRTRTTVAAHGRRPARCRQGVRRLPHDAAREWCDRPRSRELAAARRRSARWSSAARSGPLVWDDLNPQQRLSVYDRGVDLGTPDARRRRAESGSGFRIASATCTVPGAARNGGARKHGDASSPPASGRAGHRGPTAQAGLRVLDVLEAAHAQPRRHLVRSTPIEADRRADRRGSR